MSYYNRILKKINSLKTLFNKSTRKYKKKVTKESLLQDLAVAGINENDTILVHSSLSKIGNVDGGPVTIINCLLEKIGPKGNLIMPSYSYLGSMMDTAKNENFIFDPQINPSVVGIITETFRKLTGVKRSIHPTHSVCAYGPMANYITGNHHLTETNFGTGTPFHHIRELQGKIVGLGISIGPVTIYHTLEDFYPELFKGVYLEHPVSFKVSVNGQELIKKVSIHNPTFHSERIDKSSHIESWIADHLRNKKILHESGFGTSTIWWMNIQELFDELLVLKSKNISIYGVPVDNES
jgi:aminoglycoside 3-N-acetyltransferase